MKILCAEYNSAGEMAVVPMGDDVLLRNNDDFYIPEFTSLVSCVPQLVVRICKLGKHVNARFAERYYEEIGVGVRFYADSFEQELLKKGLPGMVASSFDGSAAISDLTTKESCEDTGIVFKVNGKQVYQEEAKNLIAHIEQLLVLASQYHTLKIGDFLFCGNVFRYFGLQLEDRIEIEMTEKLKMDFRLK